MDNILKYLYKKCLVNSYSTKHLSQTYKFNTIEECNKSKSIAKNPSRPHYKQYIYHIGTRNEFINEIEKFKLQNEYKNNVIETFEYIFNYLKKGIYVSIKDGCILIFLPFSNDNYKNIFSHLLKVNPAFKPDKDIKYINKYPGITAYVKQMDKIDRNRDVNKDITQWYANNCIFRNTVYGYNNEGPNQEELRFKVDEGDKSITNFLELLIETCVNYKIPDTCFFINPRDFPILKIDGSGPYDAIYSNIVNPIISANRSSFLQILSQSTSESYMDLLIPNDDDIVRVLNIITTGSNCKSINDITDPVSWELKKNVAVFRGSATGCSITIENNKRLQVALLSKLNPKLIDASLTGLNNRLKKDPHSDYIGHINPDQVVDWKTRTTIRHLVNKTYMNDKETSSYKYIIDIEGHVASFRLGRMFGLGSVILKVDSEWKLWFSYLLNGLYYDEINETNVRSIQYVKVRNVDELLKVVEFLNKNDRLAKIIADNGKIFFNKYLNKDAVLKYTAKLLTYTSNLNIKIFDMKPFEQFGVKNFGNGLIITTYRNREKHLQKFKEYLLKNINMDLLIVEQQDNLKFNRGFLINVGLNEILKRYPNKYSYIILNDVDLLPDENLIKLYHKFPTFPIHLGTNGQRYSEDPNFTGGVLSLSIKDYIKVNGYPNNIWGWGLEDEILRDRLLFNVGNIKKISKNEGSVIDLEEMTIKDKLDKLRKDNAIVEKEEKIKLRKNIKDSNGYDELPTQKYKIIDFKESNINGLNLYHLNVSF